MADLDEVEPAVSVEGELKICLHAVTDQKGARTMQVKVVLHNYYLRDLVDSGSTYNFISLTTARNLGIKVRPNTEASVLVANGEIANNTGICNAVTVSIDNHEFTADCFVIPLTRFDMVLGIIWLQTLGHIIWDFVSLTMSFKFYGISIILQGLQPHHDRQLNHTIGPHLHREELQLLLGEFNDMF